MIKTDFSEVINEGKPPWIDWAEHKKLGDPGVIRVFSGAFINPLKVAYHDEELAKVTPEDIAHHLAGINRYTGASPLPYSVAQHSVMAMLWAYEQGVRNPRTLMAILLHDSAEYLFNDIASPVKNDPRMNWYREEEDRVRVAITLKFGGAMAPTSEEWVSKADRAAFLDECELFAGRDTTTTYLPSPAAEDMFLRYFADLTSKIAAE